MGKRDDYTERDQTDLDGRHRHDRATKHTLAEVRAAAERASERVASWPKWKRDLASAGCDECDDAAEWIVYPPGFGGETSGKLLCDSCRDKCGGPSVEDTITMTYDEVASAQCALSVYSEHSAGYDGMDDELNHRLRLWLDARENL